MNDTPVRRSVHAYFMQRAIELAGHGWYTTRPNPRVGCVLVKDESVVGEGWHARAGEPHAERVALADCASRGQASPDGATAYVTLEPCSHTGRTPPCVDALVEAGIVCVVVGAADPNPRVDGQGLARLREAGIEIVTDVLAGRCESLNAGFNQRMRHGRPRVRVKLAMSLDGRTAAANGESQWITGEAARNDVHRLRAESGAVLIGRGTLQADDPSLNVRLAGEWSQPLRVVLDTHLEITRDAKMLSLPGDTLIFCASGPDHPDRARIQAIETAGAQVKVIGGAGAGLDLRAVLEHLAGLEINDVLVEAGPRLAGALAEARLVDEYLIYIGPKLLGNGGRGLLDMPGVQQLDQAHELVIDAIEPLGEDWRIRARPAPIEQQQG